VQRSTPVPTVRFPRSGTWLVLNPPGHPPHTCDISRVDHIEVGPATWSGWNSGNTIGPHLHFQVMDGLNFASAKVLPFAVKHSDRWLDRRGVPMHEQPFPRRRGRVRVE
jgi:hypothetical protein